MDPSSYLDILKMSITVCCKTLVQNQVRSMNRAKAVGLDTYTQMLEEANKA